MYSTYEFWRKKRDEKNMLTTLRHQVTQDTSLHFYIFFKFETLQKLSDMTRQYGGTLLWHWERRQMLGCAGGGATASGLRRLAVPFLCIGPAAVAPSRLPDAVLVGSRSASATTRITSSRCLIPRAHLGSGTVDKTCIRLDWRPATHRRPGLVRAEQ